MQDTLLYYNLAAVHVIKHFIIVMIPFNSAMDFHLYSLIPFHVLVNNTSIIWNDVKQNFVLSKTKLLIAFINEEIE